MTKIMLLAMALTVSSPLDIETTDRGMIVTVEAPETGYYSGCWLSGFAGTIRDPEKLAENCWLFPVSTDRGIITLVHCTDQGCHLIEHEFLLSPPLVTPKLLITLGTALLAGFLMNFMPCVLPAIALKLRAFTEPGKRASYIAGVMASFMVLATLSLWIGSGLSLMGFGHYRLTLSLICFLFGMSLFGCWTIPSFGASGTLGPFGLGILTVALGSSCAVPFLAPAMAYTASCSVFETYLIFGALGGGFCSPFIFPIPWLDRFPRHYLPLVERVCGAAMLGVATWIFCTLPPDFQPPTLMLAGSTLGILVWVTKVRHQISTRNFWSPVMLTVMIGFGLCGLDWLDLVSTRVTTVRQDVPALDQPQVTFVTASWCMNCPPMKATLHDERVVSRLSELGLVPKFLDYTDRPPEVREFLVASYATDVPVLRIVAVDGTVTVLSGLWTPSAILEALE